MPRRLVFLASLAAALVSGAATVAVSIPPLKWAVSQLGDADVCVVVPEGADPHSYEPRPSQMAELSEAKVWLTCGMPFENVMAKKLPSVKTVQVLPSDRPHGWLSPSGMESIVRATAAALNDAGVAVADGALEKALAKVAEVRESVKAELADAEKRTIWTVHPSWGAFAEEFGLKMEALEVNGAEPSPRQLAKAMANAKSSGIRSIIVDAGHHGPEADVFVGQVGAKIVELNPLSSNWPSEMLKAAALVE